MWKTAWDITSANSGAKRLKKNPDVTSWAEGQIRQVVSPSSLVPGPLSTLADRGRGLAPPPAQGCCRGCYARQRRALADWLVAPEPSPAPPVHRARWRR